MRVFDFVSIRLTLYLIVGILLGFYFEITPQISVITLLVLLLVFYGLKVKQSREGFPYFENHHRTNNRTCWRFCGRYTDFYRVKKSLFPS